MSVIEARVVGLARNPAAPVDVLVRLLQREPGLACRGFAARREIPRPLQELMADSPEAAIRSVLAEHPSLDADLRDRLLADPEWRVAVRAFSPRLTDEQVTAVLTRIEDPDGFWYTTEELWGELDQAMGYDRRRNRLAAAHPDPRIRLRAAELGGWLDDASRARLLNDAVPEIRETVAAAIAEDERVMQPADLPPRHGHAFWYVVQRPLSRELVEQLLDDESALYFIGPNPSTPPDVVEALMDHPSPEVRQRLAGRAELTPDQLRRLAADPDRGVRTAVSVHPGLTEEQRAVIDIDFTALCDDDERVPPMAGALSWARSVNPLLRRRAARHPEAPLDLADDPDFGVRARLARNHPQAPPELLLRCFLEYQGPGRELFAESPRFPTEGLARFIDHDDPAVRQLAARDPNLSPELAARDDPDLSVRQAMAACPCLPRSRIVALLDDPELAEHAAANPALPAGSMEWISRG